MWGSLKHWREEWSGRLESKIHPVKSREAGTAKQLFNGVKINAQEKK